MMIGVVGILISMYLFINTILVRLIFFELIPFLMLNDLFINTLLV